MFRDDDKRVYSSRFIDIDMVFLYGNEMVKILVLFAISYLAVHSLFFSSLKSYNINTSSFFILFAKYFYWFFSRCAISMEITWSFACKQ